MNAHSTAPTTLEGTVIDGKYRLEAELGEGGMGAVWRATQINVGRSVAIKLLHAHFANEQQFSQRFETEARAIARLNHPNCVTLHDFGYSEELKSLFIVVEFLEGHSLFPLIADRQPLARLVDIMRQVAIAIEHAHSHKIIHRDLKPENVMLVPTSRGQDLVKVLDFGIARLAEEGESSDETQIRVTRAGQVFGTPPYMSPEQARARLNVTHSTDLYSIGVMLYELIEGRLPFMSSTPVEVALMHITEPVPPLQRTDVPAPLERIIFKLLEKDPADRYPDCGELIKAFDALDLPEERVFRVASVASLEMADTEEGPGLTQRDVPMPAMRAALTENEARSHTGLRQRQGAASEDAEFARGQTIVLEEPSQPSPSRRASRTPLVAALGAGIIVLGLAAMMFFGGDKVESVPLPEPSSTLASAAEEHVIDDQPVLAPDPVLNAESDAEVQEGPPKAAPQTPPEAQSTEVKPAAKSKTKSKNRPSANRSQPAPSEEKSKNGPATQPLRLEIPEATSPRRTAPERLDVP